MVALKGDKGDRRQASTRSSAELAERQRIWKASSTVADFNDADKLGKGKEMVDRLSKLVASLTSPALTSSKNRAEGDDILGDAYEYLMRHFATESGKSKGQFYTPGRSVPRDWQSVIGIGTRHARADQTYPRPACGSGSLLLKAAR